MGAGSIAAKLQKAQLRVAALEDALFNLFIAGREEADAQSEAAMLNPDSSYDEADASRTRCDVAERALEAAEAVVEPLLARRLGEHYIAKHAVDIAALEQEERAERDDVHALTGEGRC